jgi:[NiFe] hydrogenase assembly HybE family chaperone
MSATSDSPERPADECALERGFERVRAERMAGLPLLNERLRVEALGFRDWQGLRVGALVTPWSINLIILPAAGSTLPAVPSGESRTWAFPSGEYAFLVTEDPALGRYAQCSLFSPAFEFDSHDDAVTAARAALVALFTAPQPARVSRRGLLSGELT